VFLAPKKSTKRARKQPTAEENEDAVANSLMSLIPKSDKELRKEKRKKTNERNERRTLKRQKQLMDEEGAGAEFTLVKSAGADGENDDEDGEQPLTREEIERRQLLAAGMGKMLPAGSAQAADDAAGFDIVKQDRFNAVDSNDYSFSRDNRSYDSDSEDYDTHDVVRHKAMGTLMLQSSRKRALIDSSYNR
jgi:hypothetical protein